jgi:hypothetical protein
MSKRKDENGLKFSDNNYILVNDKGNDKCEIILIDGIPTVNSISLAPYSASFLTSVVTGTLNVPVFVVLSN